MQADTKAGIGVGAGFLAASVLGQTRAFDNAERAMNAQIEHDLDVLAQTGHLPDARPILPLSTEPHSKVRMFLTSMLFGFLIPAVPTGLVTLIGSLGEAQTPPALAVLSALFFGTALGVIFGWVPGLFIFAARGHRENVRRVEGLIIECYTAYWNVRQDARDALRIGMADPMVVAHRLQAHHLAAFE